MTELQKEEIKKTLVSYVEKYPSQAKAIQSLKNVSEATVINMLKGKWNHIADEMWWNVGKQIGFSPAPRKWKVVHTKPFKTLLTLFADAQQYSNVFAIIANEGAGKTSAARWYKDFHSNVVEITVADYWNKRIFLEKILIEMGKKEQIGSINQMMEAIVDNCMKLETVLFLFNELDKASDSILYFLITFYNMLEGKAGMGLLGTEFLKKRIENGVIRQKKGYAEIYSRFGRRFITIPKTTKEELEEICKENGVYDDETVSSIYNEFENDIRRVKIAVHAQKIMQEKKGLKPA